ncbi:hypothetical protein IJ095_01490 [Candidatus Saccharibacteria bacterium]|nr:hypothetical protein [Candidatus Saccharibacteria bacterium]
MENKSIIDSIEKVIRSHDADWVFSAKDFSRPEYDPTTVRQCLNRLESQGKIKRIITGIYYSPRFNELLNEVISPSISKTAEAIARKNNWSIVPDGETALNILGLSTQVPSQWRYASSGPNTEYDIYGVALSFYHVRSREVASVSRKTAIIVQAIKAIGEEKIDDRTINHFSQSINTADRNTLLQDSASEPEWIAKILKRIALDE